MRLAQPTISAQLKALENALGEKLFNRDGRRLVLTEIGRLAYRYAEDIFGLGQELQDTLKGRPTSRPIRLIVGIADALPKLIAYRLLEPVMDMPQKVQLSCFESEPRRLLADLAAHSLDIVLSDSPPLPTFKFQAHCHLLGQCGLTLLAVPSLAVKYRRNFPASLDNAPFLLPTANTALRRSMEVWFERKNIQPYVVAEFEDSALLKAFGQDGRGILPVHNIIESEVRKQYGLHVVGKVDSAVEHFYAISVSRKLSNPAVAMIQQAAEQFLFA